MNKYNNKKNGDEKKWIKSLFYLINIIFSNKFFLIIVIVFLLFYEKYLIDKKIYMKRKIIFSFWEPENNIPGYLSLCIKTWKKYLSDYEIKILNYKTLKDYIGEELYSKIISTSMPFYMQADAIRISLLNKFGGLWLDTDTIILNGNFIKKYEKYELTMIGEEKNKFQYIGFIFASQNSRVLNKWLSQIINNVKEYNSIINRNKSNLPNKMRRWNYLGNSIIDPLLRNNTNIKFLRLDINIINAFPERIYFKNLSKTTKEQYREFYFEKGDPDIILNSTKTKYIILLHNSWTPTLYKNMTEKEFLSQDILISKLLSKLLKIK